MQIKFIFALLVMGYSLFAFAETCPSVQDLKKNLPQDWIAYDSEDGTRLSLIREKQFKHNAEEFVLAEWTSNKHKTSGSIHCYYRNKSGSNLEAYLAKNDFIPEDSHHFWYEVSDARHCVAGNEKCIFKSKKVLPKNHLARS